METTEVNAVEVSRNGDGSYLVVCMLSDSILSAFTSFAAKKINCNPLAFEIMMPDGSMFRDFTFERHMSLRQDKFYWVCSDTLYKPTAQLYEAIALALDEVIKVEAMEVIEGPSDAHLHSENLQRQRDHSMVFAAIRGLAVSSDSD